VILRILICLFVLSLPVRTEGSSGSIWDWGENWFLNPLYGRESGDEIPLTVSCGFWGAAWEDVGTGISTVGGRGIYLLDAMLVVERYMPLFRISYGKFDVLVSRGGSEHRSPGSTRLEAEIALSYRVLPTAALFGGWRVLRYSYMYLEHFNDASPGGSSMVMHTEPVFGGFEAGFLMAVPLGRRAVLYARGAVASLSTEEEGYPRISGERLELGAAARPFAVPVMLRLGYRSGRFFGEERTIALPGRIVDERLEGAFLEISYTFRTRPSGR